MTTWKHTPRPPSRTSQAWAFIGALGLLAVLLAIVATGYTLFVQAAFEAANWEPVL